MVDCSGWEYIPYSISWISAWLYPPHWLWVLIFTSQTWRWVCEIYDGVNVHIVACLQCHWFHLSHCCKSWVQMMTYPITPILAEHSHIHLKLSSWVLMTCTLNYCYPDSAQSLAATLINLYWDRQSLLFQLEIGIYIILISNDHLVTQWKLCFKLDNQCHYASLAQTYHVCLLMLFLIEIVRCSIWDLGTFAAYFLWNWLYDYGENIHEYII